MPLPQPAPQHNRLTLMARIAELQSMRYTPAGMPALDLRLAHASIQHEAGSDRQVQFTLKAIAFGTLSERLARQALESLWRFDGFLASARGGKGVVFHIQEFQPQ